jgi:hypothetical protein
MPLWSNGVCLYADKDEKGERGIVKREQVFAPLSTRRCTYLLPRFRRVRRFKHSSGGTQEAREQPR